MIKRNYQKELEQLLENLKSRNKIPKLLLHSCCAPCSSYVLSYLSPYFNITVFYYNPNISPEEEYLFRKKEQIDLLSKIKAKNTISFLDCDYEDFKFYQISSGLENEKEGGKRCFNCYRLRLEKTAVTAKALGFEFFGSTLSVSPYKNAIWLNDIGKSLENKYSVSFLISDFKKKDGYKKSIELSKQFNLYRQNYCGCIYSEQEMHERLKKAAQSENDTGK